MVDLGVRRPPLERFFRAPLRRRVVPQVREHRPVGQARGSLRIDLEHLLEDLLGLGVPLAVDQVVDLEQQAVDVLAG